MTRKLYVTNLPLTLDEDSIKEVFDPCGEVLTTKIIRDRAGVSKRLGFVTMANDEEALEAMQQLDGKLVSGEVIGVGVKPPTQGWNSPRIRRESI